ncbi:hypothetical protein KY304_02045, partial [Candidatus Woesearchaeota archaeon]|nr:hypothetical protein [Candidatus Woesearchaeota archaeon]
MTNKKINAIIMAILIILTPLVYADIDTSEEFELTAQVPTITKTNKITITGTTKPNTEIKITLNKAVISETQSNSNGEFEIKEIILLHENNELSIRAKDSNGNIRVLNYNVKMDKTPPKVTYDEIPKGATTRTLQIKGTSTEPVTIQYRTSNTTIFKNVNVNKTFTIPIELEDGLNKIELIAKDSAGNTDTQKFETTYDISSPQFQNTNLNKLEPCYFDWPLGISKKIDLTGQLNEKSTIYVYVNHESTPSKIRTTD